VVFVDVFMDVWVGLGGDCMRYLWIMWYVFWI